MTKYDEQFKLKAVRRYLAGRSGAQAVATELGMSRSVLRRWVASYQAHGRAGLVKKFSQYSAAFKCEVLERIEREGLSDQQAAALYDIRNAGAIGIWRGQYDVGGVGALAPHPKGRRPMPHKYPPAPVPKDMTEDELRKENAYLRAELDYLKKLEALIQAEKTEALVKKRKWSKD